MRNRARCKLCGDVIESFTRHDYVSCKCGEISIDGGAEYMHCHVKTDPNNIIVVDENGNDIVPKKPKKVKQLVEHANGIEPPPQPIVEAPPNKKALLDMLRGLIESYDRLPQSAMLTPVTQADLLSLLLLVEALFKTESA